MDPVYDAFASGRSRVVATVNGTLQAASQSQAELVSSFRPTQINASAVVYGITEKIPVTVTSGRYGSQFAEDFIIPANTTSFYVIMTGNEGGNGFLWRYISGIPSVSWQSSLHIQIYSATYVVLPSGTIFSGIFAFN